MSIPTMTELIPILQIAVGPVILVSGVGLLLLTMTNRLGRIVDRARSLAREALATAPAGCDVRLAQWDILRRRAALMRRAIILAVVSILLAALLVITLFLAALLGLDFGGLIALLFIGCLGALILSLAAFLRELDKSLEAVNLEWAEATRED